MDKKQNYYYYYYHVTYSTLYYRMNVAYLCVDVKVVQLSLLFLLVCGLAVAGHTEGEGRLVGYTAP